jgi:hypothetical protein
MQTHFPVNMASEELDLCPECKTLIYKTEAAWLDIWTSGPWYADSTTPPTSNPS